MSHRILQINELIRHELGELFVSELELPKNTLVTITKVETSKDLRHAKVSLSVLPAMYTKKIIDKVQSQAGALQFALNKKLSLKPLPRLRFVVDVSERYAADVENILDRIKEKP